MHEKKFDWEDAKENMQPLVGGRKMNDLNRILDTDPIAHKHQRQDKIAEFENLVHNEDDEDPLSDWIKYINYMKQSALTDTKEEILLLYDRCVRKFKDYVQYKNCPRYLQLWLDYANFTKEAEDIFAFLQSNKIGEKLSLFYESFAIAMEDLNKTSLAEKIFQQGLAMKAHPLERLQKRHQEFQARLMHRLQTETFDPPPANTERNEKRIALGSIVGDRAGIGNHGNKRLKNEEISIFTGKGKSSLCSKFNNENVKPLKFVPCYTKEKSKENEPVPSAWTRYSIKQQGQKVKNSKTPFSVFHDEADESRAHGYSHENALQPSKVKNDSLRQNPLKNLQHPMNLNEKLCYDKNLLLMGTLHELSPDELRARQPRYLNKRFKREKDRLEQEENIKREKERLEKLEQERLEKESRIEKERLEKERLEKENREAEQLQTLYGRSFSDDECPTSTLILSSGAGGKRLNFDTPSVSLLKQGQSQQKLLEKEDLDEDSLWFNEEIRPRSDNLGRDNDAFNNFKENEKPDPDSMKFSDPAIEPDYRIERAQDRENLTPLTIFDKDGIPIENDEHNFSRMTGESNENEYRVFNDNGKNNDLRKQQISRYSPILENQQVPAYAQDEEDDDDDDDLTELSLEDPMDIDNLELLAEIAQKKYIQDDCYFDFTSALAPNNHIFTIGKTTYKIEKTLAENRDSKVFYVQIPAEDKDCAMKVSQPANVWEFHCARTIHKSIDATITKKQLNPKGVHQKISRIHNVQLFEDKSFHTMNYHDQGNLQDALSACKKKNFGMEEKLIMFYSINMLQILEILHSAQIVHGAIKPSNLLIIGEGEIPKLNWNPDGNDGWDNQGLVLIDFKKSLDLSLYPQEKVRFEGSGCIHPSFKCAEMREGKEWSFEYDSYMFLWILFYMLHMEALDIEKVDGVWKPINLSQEVAHISLWEEIFDCLLNGNADEYLSTVTRLRKKLEQSLKRAEEDEKQKKLRSILITQSIRIDEY